MEKLDNTILHRFMCLSAKSGVSFQTARAFAVILYDSYSATYLDVASDCEQQSKTLLQTHALSLVWSLFEPHPSTFVEEISKNAKVKIDSAGSHISVNGHVPHAWFLILVQRKNQPSSIIIRLAPL